MIKDKIKFHLGIEPTDPTAVTPVDQIKGKFTFHAETDSTFMKHLLAEEKRMGKDGKWDWVRIRTNNHLLDACGIAFALADPECHGGIMIINRNGGGRRMISAGVG